MSESSAWAALYTGAVSSTLIALGIGTIRASLGVAAAIAAVAARADRRLHEHPGSEGLFPSQAD